MSVAVKRSAATSAERQPSAKAMRLEVDDSPQRTGRLSSGPAPRLSLRSHKPAEAHLNLDGMLKKQVRDKSIHQLLDMPLEVFEGISKEQAMKLEAYGLLSVCELARFECWALAKALLVAEKFWRRRRTAHPQMNISRGFHGQAEGKSPTEVLDGKLSSMTTLGERADTDFADLGIKSVRDLAKWEIAECAHALYELCPYEFQQTI